MNRRTSLIETAAIIGFLAISVCVSSGCARTYHAIHYNTVARKLKEHPQSYYHADSTGKILAKRCYNPVELPCYGYEPTCWTHFPSECEKCPVPDEVASHEVILHDSAISNPAHNNATPTVADPPETAPEDAKQTPKEPDSPSDVSPQDGEIKKENPFSQGIFESRKKRLIQQASRSRVNSNSTIKLLDPARAMQDKPVKLSTSERFEFEPFPMAPTPQTSLLSAELDFDLGKDEIDTDSQSKSDKVELERTKQPLSTMRVAQVSLGIEADDAQTSETKKTDLAADTQAVSNRRQSDTDLVSKSSATPKSSATTESSATTGEPVDSETEIKTELVDHSESAIAESEHVEPEYTEPELEVAAQNVAKKASQQVNVVEKKKVTAKPAVATKGDKSSDSITEKVAVAKKQVASVTLTEAEPETADEPQRVLPRFKIPAIVENRPSSKERSLPNPGDSSEDVQPEKVKPAKQLANSSDSKSADKGSTKKGSTTIVREPPLVTKATLKFAERELKGSMRLSDLPIRVIRTDIDGPALKFRR